MSASSTIRSQIRSQKQYLAKLQKKKKELEDAQESLELFQRSLGNVRADFSGASSGQNSSLQSLQPIVSKCESARKYTEGMNGTLNGVGSKIVGTAFVGLGGLVKTRLIWYIGQISWHTAEIKLVKQVIRNLEIALEAALAAEEALDGE